MASIISPKADVSPKAKIGDNCRIYPFVYIEDDVEIGDNCVIYPFVSILNGTRMGSGNKVFQGAVIAALPQDFNFTGEESHVVIGDNNTNRGTHAGGKTVLGNSNFLMEGAHISHDTVVGNKCVFGYGTKIAGDCEIGNSVIFSTSVIENAKTRVGDMAMIQAGTSFCLPTSSPVAHRWLTAVPTTSSWRLPASTRRCASTWPMPTDWYSTARPRSLTPSTRLRTRCPTAPRCARGWSF